MPPINQVNLQTEAIQKSFTEVLATQAVLNAKLALALENSAERYYHGAYRYQEGTVPIVLQNLSSDELNLQLFESTTLGVSYFNPTEGETTTLWALIAGTWFTPDIFVQPATPVLSRLIFLPGPIMKIKMSTNAAKGIQYVWTGRQLK